MMGCGRLCCRPFRAWRILVVPLGVTLRSPPSVQLPPFQGFRNHAIANPVDFDDESVIVSQSDATERVPPIRHCNLWLLTSQPLSFPASQLGGFAA
ncbi:MAG: hypothetical protein IKR48_08855, partial [Kiritimatiellae bacterium]|nr:hypothetical protein [Kiritimatiellia bacterium]